MKYVLLYGTEFGVTTPLDCFVVFLLRLFFLGWRDAGRDVRTRDGSAKKRQQNSVPSFKPLQEYGIRNKHYCLYREQRRTHSTDPSFPYWFRRTNRCRKSDFLRESMLYHVYDKLTIISFVPTAGIRQKCHRYFT
jgi:hypothetical protein